MGIKDIAIACQGGGSHAAYTAGVLTVLLEEFDNLALARAAHGPAYREAGTGAAEAPVLAAISGTSGGAISALLGWYGFITGGAAEAQRRLDRFWDSNAATHWLEASVNHVSRALSDLSAMWGWDVKSSPYAWPMQGLELVGASVWPMVARALGPDNPWMRPDYFGLPQLLRPCVDWQLIQAYGDFASIPLDVQRWVRSDLEARLFPADAPCQQRYRAERDAIAQGIEDKLGAARRVLARLDQLGIGDTALLRAAFGRWQAPRFGDAFNHEGLTALAGAVQRVTRCIPHLLIGAVELHQGDFVAFSSERAAEDKGLSIDAVMASASVPWLFRAREMRGTDPDTLAPRQLVLWDGLFSQNPPVKDFLSGVLDEAKKPDEIWVVQINPSQARARAGKTAQAPDRIVLTGGEIWDLRNALAGNLSLNQELAFVDAINRRMETAPPSTGAVPDGEAEDMHPPPQRRPDKLVRVDRIVMDGEAIEAATGMDLGANSKLDRDPRLKQALCEHGRVQARRYLALRGQVEGLCGELGHALSGVRGSAAGSDPARSDGDARPVMPDRVAPDRVAPDRVAPDRVAPDRVAPGKGALVLDGATLYGTGAAGSTVPRALVRWRTVDAELGGRPVRIEGRSELADDLGAGGAWRVKDVRITAMAPRRAVPLREAGGQPQPGPGLQTAAGSSRPQ